MAFKYDSKYASPAVGGPPVAVNRTGSVWSGLVDVTSSTANLTTVTAPVVDATDLIFLSTKTFGIETAQVGPFTVRSVNPGVGFVIGPQTSGAVMVTSYQVSFMVLKA